MQNSSWAIVTATPEQSMYAAYIRKMSESLSSEVREFGNIKSANNWLNSKIEK